MTKEYGYLRVGLYTRVYVRDERHIDVCELDAIELRRLISLMLALPEFELSIGNEKLKDVTFSKRLTMAVPACKASFCGKEMILDVSTQHGLRVLSIDLNWADQIL